MLIIDKESYILDSKIIFLCIEDVESYYEIDI